MRVWLLAAAVVAAAFVAGRWTRPRPIAPTAPTVARAAPERQRQDAPPPSIAAVRAAGVAAALAPREPPPVESEAREIVDRALRGGVLTDDVARELRWRLAEVSEDTQRELISKVIVAINRQELKVTAEHPF